MHAALEMMACSLLHELCPLNSVQVLYYSGSPTSELLASTLPSTPYSSYYTQGT